MRKLASLVLALLCWNASAQQITLNSPPVSYSTGSLSAAISSCPCTLASVPAGGVVLVSTSSAALKLNVDYTLNTSTNVLTFSSAVTSNLSGSFTATWLYATTGAPQTGVVPVTSQALTYLIMGWGANYASVLSGTIVRTTDGYDQITTSPSIVWPDGASGALTVDTYNTGGCHKVDAYHITHVSSSGTQTFTQTAVTYDSSCGVTYAPPPTYM